MAVGKWAYEQRRDCVGTEDGGQLRIRRIENDICPFRKIRIVAVKYRPRHERFRADNIQAVNFRNDLRIIRKINKLRSSSRVPVIIRLNVEREVKVHGLKTIEKTKIALAASRSTLLRRSSG